MELSEFAAKQTALIAQMAAEYVIALRADRLLWLDYITSDDCLNRSLRSAVDQGNPYAVALSASDLRREIERRSGGGA